MKKLFSVLILGLMVVACSLGFIACTSSGGGDTATGLLYKMYPNDDYYTVYGYVKEEGETDTVIDIGAIADNVGITIKRINKGAFKDNDTITEIIVPSTVEKIEEGAFANMKALKKITLPFIGKTAIADAYYNSSDDITDDTKSVDKERLFGFIFGTEEYTGGVKCEQNYNKESTDTRYIPFTLKEVKLAPKSEYTIPMFAFSGNTWIKTLSLSDKVTQIGECAFKDNVLLKTVNTENVMTLYSHAFLGAKNIEVLDLSNLNEIKDNGEISTLGAFDSCTALKEVTINIATIPHDSFSNCTSLVTLNVKSDVTKIGARAFYNCSNLSAITDDGTNSWTANGDGVTLSAQNITVDYVNYDWTR